MRCLIVPERLGVCHCLKDAIQKTPRQAMDCGTMKRKTLSHTELLRFGVYLLLQQSLSYPDYNNHSVLVSIEICDVFSLSYQHTFQPTFVESTELATVSVYGTERILM